MNGKSLSSDRPVPGAHIVDGGVLFRLWSPEAEKATLRIEQDGIQRDLFMTHADEEYWEIHVEDAEPGDRYLLSVGDDFFPDPASRSQPDGVHAPSEVVDLSFEWRDRSWRGIPREYLVFYELHAGTFTTEGTLDAIEPHLDRLGELGITALELMPVAQFPGERNWGYDGVYPWSVQNSYGGPRALQRLVDRSHARGIAVFLDVVYNHLGPEGNYLAQFGPYFTGRYRTPWGDAVNFDGPWSDGVRAYFIESALSWLRDFHIDGLRLDAVHAILDHSSYPFLRELADRTNELEQQLGRPCHLIAESDRNDPILLRSPEMGGYGLDAQWSDDFHHSVHALLTGEREGYYEDFGSLWHLEKSLGDVFVYDGRHSTHRKRRHGASAGGLDGSRFVIAIQNHDQVGNRMHGERLASLVSFEHQKLAAGLLLLSPYLPLIFMGEEMGETAPFLYFTSHSDPDLVQGVRSGRKEEFASFSWRDEPPDPQDVDTFLRSRIDHTKRSDGPGSILHALYHDLLKLRRSKPALRETDRHFTELHREENRLDLIRKSRVGNTIVASFNLGDETVASTETPGLQPIFSSTGFEAGRASGSRASGTGLAPYSFSVYEVSC